mgnify:CR=1 FL=1
MISRIAARSSVQADESRVRFDPVVVALEQVTRNVVPVSVSRCPPE